jgi:hypothetical protein
MSDISKEYTDFMKWFKENHPEVHEKYGRNISVPMQEGGGVTVTPSYKITQAEQDMVTNIARQYYKQKEG